VRSLARVKPGEYYVQALLHKYETFDRGEGRQWSRAPGNLYSKPAKVRLDGSSGRLELTRDQEIPPVAEPKDSRYVRRIKIRSDRLSKFWGRPMYLGAHVLLPEGFDEHPEARYPLVIFRGHFPAGFSGFRTEPPTASSSRKRTTSTGSGRAPDSRACRSSRSSTPTRTTTIPAR
jgi:hypothetical protein